MAKVQFTNLNILESGKGGLNQIFSNKKAMGELNTGLGNVNKDFGDGKAGTKINNKVSGENTGFKNMLNKGKGDADNGPTNMKKSLEPHKRVDGKAAEKVPMKNEIKTEKWMTETSTGPEADVQNKEDYSGKVVTKETQPVHDTDKQQQVDYMNEQNSKSTEKQKTKQYDHQDRNQYKPKPLKNTIGKGPSVIDNPVSASVNDYNMKSPVNPNPEMYPGASKPTGQAPTPKFPKNGVTKMVGGMKQPPTSKPSMSLPRG
jgi:hypothetical protein